MNKFNVIKKLLTDHYKKNIIIHKSPDKGYRSRVEFGFTENVFTMYGNKNKIFLTTFDIAKKEISTLMPKLLEEIKFNDEIQNKLFQVNFRSNSLGYVMISLIYHKEISKKLIDLINQISIKLNCEIILRSKKFFYSTGTGFLEDVLNINEQFILYQTDQSFYQPNFYLLPKMIKKVKSLIKKPNDLIELYCGSGTFTIPLSKQFKRIFATENNRKSIICLEKGIKKNNIDNISYARISDDEVSELFNGRKFKRMKNIQINEYNFSHILVDPPRSGLSKNLISILMKFKNIIYISCNFDTYLRDIKLLSAFEIIDIELFDQFPNTSHVEIVSLLKQK